MRSFSYIPRAGFTEKFQSLTFVILGFLVRSFSYTPRADFSEEFQSLTILMPGF